MAEQERIKVVQKSLFGIAVNSTIERSNERLIP